MVVVGWVTDLMVSKSRPDGLTRCAIEKVGGRLGKRCDVGILDKFMFWLK